MESYHSIATDDLFMLSPQQLVDCASDDQWGNYGCEGGFVDYALIYAENYPLMEERNYPY